MAGTFGEVFLVSVVSHEMKHENSSNKNRGQFGAKFGAKCGTKIRQIRGTFILQLSDRILLRSAIQTGIKKYSRNGFCRDP